MEITTRNASLGDLAEMLQQQQTRKIDMVVPASKMRMKDGVLRVEGAEPLLESDGVTQQDGLYRPTTVFDEGVSQKLGIPLPYVRRMRNERLDLYDANVNGWLHGAEPWAKYDGNGEVLEGSVGVPADPRKFLVRAFRGVPEYHPEGPIPVPAVVGIARAFLSDSYKMMDNLDALTAALEGVKDAGLDVRFAGCDLTERRMTVKIVAEEVSALAPTLLQGYRSPFSGQSGSDLPVVFAGFVLSNSETGGGAFTLTPRLEVKICTNGLVIGKDAMRAVHLGGKMDEGVIAWSGDTLDKTAALITAKTRDAVRTFLDREYLENAVAFLEERAAVPLGDAVRTVQQVTKKLAFSEEQTKGVLDHFVRGGQMTAGGVMNAVTSYAQTVEDGDVAYELEAQGVKALELAAV